MSIFTVGRSMSWSFYTLLLSQKTVGTPALEHNHHSRQVTVGHLELPLPKNKLNYNFFRLQDHLSMEHWNNHQDYSKTQM